MLGHHRKSGELEELFILRLGGVLNCWLMITLILILSSISKKNIKNILLLHSLTFYKMKNKINLKFKTLDDHNFYDTGPRTV